MCKLINFFTFKDKIPIFLCSDIVYKVKCGDCNATYYCKTKHYFKEYNNSAIKENQLLCNHYSDFSILASNKNELKSFLIN